MGCDIHLYVEMRNKESKKWESLDHTKYDKYFDEYGVDHVYDDRDYKVFSILANVRNYDNIEPISDPRGVPFDTCELIRKEYDAYYEYDMHSASYVTLKELNDYKQSHSKIKNYGMITPKQYEDLQNGILPTSWCRWTTDETYVEAEWELPLASTSLDSLIDTLEKLTLKHVQYTFTSEEDKQEKIKSYADDVRIVFWFDN